MRPISTGQPWFTQAESDSFGRYLNDIRAYKPLTRSEELDAFARLRAGDSERQLRRLTLHNQRFIVSVAKREQRAGALVGLEDLVQAGNIGLISAVEGYDPSKGFKFITYAVSWIRKYMLEEIARHEMTISRPQHHQQQHQRENALVDRHALLTGESLGEEQVRAALTAQGHLYAGKGQMDVRHTMLRLDFDAHSAEGHAGEPRSMHEYLAGETPGDVAERERESHLRECTARALAELPELQARVLTLSFGLGGGEAMGSEYVAHALGLSMQRLKKVKAEAMAAFKAALLALVGCPETELARELLCA